MKTIIRSRKDFAGLIDNEVLGALPVMNKSRITFNGTGNLLYCEEGVRLDDCTISFNGNNGLVVLGKSKHVYKMVAAVHGGCTLAIGRDNFFNPLERLRVAVSERRTVFIGDDNLFAFGVWIRTADPHLVYDLESNKRLNWSKDVIVGDHTWVGQHALLLKGTMLGSGCIVGGGNVVAGKRIHSNSSWGGNPAKPIRDKVFWDRACVHNWSVEQSEQSAEYDKEPFAYSVAADTIGHDALLRAMDGCLTPHDRLSWLLRFGYGNARRNRLAMERQ